MNDLPEFPPSAFLKQDPAPDEQFYAAPRFVTHIDDDAIATVTALYRRLFPPGGAVLDLMSSWISHLPSDVVYREVIGHGMNAEELGANRQLTRSFVQTSTPIRSFQSTARASTRRRSASPFNICSSPSPFCAKSPAC
jgi:hypothetical protein